MTGIFSVQFSLKRIAQMEFQKGYMKDVEVFTESLKSK